jgi:hypothetical protein
MIRLETGDCLFGLEVEFALSTKATAEGEIQLQRKLAIERVFGALSRRVHLPSFRPGTGSWFMNGEVYVDRGDHLEFASAEVCNPRDAVLYEKSGERMIALAVADILRDDPEAGISIIKNNQDYHIGTTYGCHESYLMHRQVDTPEIRRQIVPFLVSRVWAGAGSVSIDPGSPGMALFQRAPFITRECGIETTRDRPILNLRDETLSDGNHRRLHLIVGDSLMSQIQTFLKTGVTAIVVKLIDCGIQLADDIDLVDPVRAFKEISADLFCTRSVMLTSGKKITGCAIQRHYLAKAEKHLRYLPSWADDVIREWDNVLTLLENNDARLNTMLDSHIKQFLFADWLKKRDMDFATINRWRAVFRSLRVPFEKLIEAPSRLLEMAFREHILAHRQTTGGKPDIHRIMRTLFDFYKLDILYHDINPSTGLYYQLDRQGLLNDRIIADDEEILRAMEHSPSGTRAAVRGAVIADLAAREVPAAAAWTSVNRFDQDSWLDLMDPFENKESWKSHRRPPGQRPSFLDRLIEL